ncbi:hypothetical protein UFOVP660_6 [uncultured Caudovirales phage]|uniref:Uncharacterized protein n=1 Tax=uncultured Caudovirales phage TaxID=2100421 RepID=A0A6J5NEH6_9CAUD|nr:hypothetical protein UFOVP660_6 [uncultured Caudovirales phage]
MDWTDLKAYVGASSQDDDFAKECWDTATDLIASYVQSTKVPNQVLKRCTLEVGSELFHRRSAPMGISQYSSYDGAPIRIARDPLAAVYPLLNRYMVRFA